MGFLWIVAVSATYHGPAPEPILQAAGGCAGMLVSRAIISDLFHAREAARILSLMMLVQGLAPIVAPILGGHVIAAAGWRAVFVFLAGLVWTFGRASGRAGQGVSL